MAGGATRCPPVFGLRSLPLNHPSRLLRPGADVHCRWHPALSEPPPPPLPAGIYGTGNFRHKFLPSPAVFLKPLTSFVSCIDASIHEAISFISCSFIPREVMAGVPKRIPEGLAGGVVSWGTLL